MIRKYCRKGNVLICQYDLITYVDKINDDDVILGETNSSLIEGNCILIDEKGILKDGLLRIEFKNKVLGVKVGYIDFGNGECVVLKSMNKLYMILLYVALIVLLIVDVYFLMNFY